MWCLDSPADSDDLHSNRGWMMASFAYFLWRDSESSILLENKSAYCSPKYESIDWLKREWYQNNNKAAI